MSKQAIDELGLRDWVGGLPDGLDTVVGERGGRLSVGERQLVALARAQVADPGLLLLDEATSAVDPETEEALAAALDPARGRPDHGVDRPPSFDGGACRPRGGL